MNQSSSKKSSKPNIPNHNTTGKKATAIVTVNKHISSFSISDMYMPTEDAPKKEK